MTDIVSPEKRSAMMSSVGSKDTKPEMIVRRILHGMGYRFRVHSSTLPGTPDVVLPRHRKVVFVHGCFWHGHPGCKNAARPASNTEFWDSKLDRNISRDAAVKRELEEQGWDVFVVWECEARDKDALAASLRDFMEAKISEPANK
jgi:DNA mismatch endonuclease (patch repair protein)